MKDVIEYSRNCPDCDKVLKTKNKYYYNKAVSNNSKCGSCTLKGRTFSDEHKANMSKNHADVSGDKNPFYQKKHTDEALRTISETKKENYKNDPSLAKSISDRQIEWHKTNDNPFKGKTHSDEVKDVIREMANKRWENPEERANASAKSLKWLETHDTNFKGMKHTVETRKQMRVAAIKRIEEAKFNGGQMMPNYNISSIMILEEIAKEMGITDLQHAENGGEFHIKELGYFVDGYSKEKNIVLEYDEPHHFNSDGNLKESDIIRQNEIEEYLDCTFIRITE